MLILHLIRLFCAAIAWSTTLTCALCIDYILIFSYTDRFSTTKLIAHVFFMMSQGFDNGTSKNEHETNHVILGQRQINKHCNETKLCFNGLKFLSIGKVKNCFKLNWKRINISEDLFCEQTFVIASCFKHDFIFPILEITLNDFETNGQLQYLKKILVLL